MRIELWLLSFVLVVVRIGVVVLGSSVICGFFSIVVRSNSLSLDSSS